MPSNNELNKIKNLSLKFNSMLRDNKEREVSLCIERMPDYIFSENDRPHIPNHLFFVWIGMLKDKKYIDIWKMSKVRPIVYFDSKAYLSGFYLKEITKISDKKGLSIIEIQDDFYSYFNDNKLHVGGSFDLVFLKYLDEHGINRREYYLNKVDTYLKEIRENNEIDFIDINAIDNIFLDSDFIEFYCYEVILRNNLAAASDIVRLQLLRKYGGMYVDLDTLPDISYIFKKTNALLNSSEGINENIVDIVKSEAFLKRNFPDNDFCKKEAEVVNFCLSYINQYENLHDYILEDIFNWDGELRQFTFPKVPKELICISSSKNNISEYNNNILASHPNSKIINILLRQMKKRYNYSKKRGFIINEIKEHNFKTNPYYERLKHYRKDGMKNSDNVTLIMTGPLFIMEVLLGISYQLLSIDTDVSALAISYALRVEQLGLSFDKQTMFTLEHAKSSWM